MMVVDDRRDRGPGRQDRYRKGLPGYHDPTAGIGGAAPAYSALTLRLCLAVFGVLTSVALGLWMLVLEVPTGFVVVLVVLAGVGVIDIAVIVRRKRRGEPG